MSEAASTGAPERPASAGVSEDSPGNPRLAILLSMAMFVLVVDTSVMNVSISAVVHDLHTTVSSVQSAIALEALVSAAFILIGSKVGDLFGRKRAYVLGLLGYAIGALAMALAQSLTAVIVFWAIIGGLGASLLLPAMQSLIHGNFEGDAQRKAYALVGAAAAIAAAVGPLIGGFITTYLSWRVAFLLEDVVILIVLSGIRLVRDAPYTGPRGVDPVGAGLSVLGMGGIVLGILVWQEGGDFVAPAVSAWSRWRGWPTGSCAASARASRCCWTRSVQVRGLPIRDLAAAAAADRLGRDDDRAADLPADRARIQRPAGGRLARAALAHDVRGGGAGRQEGGQPAAEQHHPIGLCATHAGLVVLIPIVPRASSGWYLVVPLMIAGSGLGLLVSQLNNYTLSPISEERVSEAAGVNSAAGSFGLSFGLAFGGAILLATLSVAFTNMAEESTVLPPPSSSRWPTRSSMTRKWSATLSSKAAARRSTQGRQGRDHPHQHRRQAPRPSGGAARSDPRGAHRPVQLIPDDAPTRPQAIERGRRHGARLTLTRERASLGQEVGLERGQEAGLERTLT